MVAIFSDVPISTVQAFEKQLISVHMSLSLELCTNIYSLVCGFCFYYLTVLGVNDTHSAELLHALTTL